LDTKTTAEDIVEGVIEGVFSRRGHRIAAHRTTTRATTPTTVAVCRADAIIRRKLKSPAGK
jgi:hypothetical protein